MILVGKAAGLNFLNIFQNSRPGQLQKFRVLFDELGNMPVGQAQQIVDGALHALGSGEKRCDVRITDHVDAERVVDFFERNGGDWTVFDADEGRTALEWGVTKVPESYLVSPDGTVVKRIVGGVTREELDALMAAARGGS